MVTNSLAEMGEYSSSSGSDLSSSSCYSESSSSTSSSDYADNQLSAAEKLQIESCFKALSTQVYVCGSLANMYTCKGSSSWELAFTGVPVVLLDTGEARSRRSRGIRLVLAERGSCLALWHDKIDNLSAYRCTSSGWHTMCRSNDHTARVGLSFSSRTAADQLWAHIERLTADPENICLSVPGKKNRQQHKQPKFQLPPKAQISQPCCFQHVTSVGTTDINRYASLQTLLPPNQEKQ